MSDFSPWRSGEKWVEIRLHGSVTVPCTVLSIKVKHNILDDLVEVYIAKWISMSLGWKTATKKVLKLSDLITVCWANCLLWCLYCFAISHVDMDMTQCTTRIIFNSRNTNEKPSGAGHNLQRACLWARNDWGWFAESLLKALKWFSGPGCELHSPGDPVLFTGYSWECSPVGVGGAQSRCKMLVSLGFSPPSNTDNYSHPQVGDMQNEALGSPPWSNCAPGVPIPPILNVGFGMLSCLPRSVWTLDFLFQDVALELWFTSDG